MGKWIRRVLAAVLVAAAVAGCGGACTAKTPAVAVVSRPVAVAPTPVPNPAESASAVVGVWQVVINNNGDPVLLAFWPAGVLASTDPGYGLWRPRATGPGVAEGMWHVPMVRLTITFAVELHGDALIGTGVAFTADEPNASYHPLTFTGSRLAIDPAALKAIAPPRPS